VRGGSIPRDAMTMQTDRPTCKDCGTQSPETNTNYTLISQQHGWRLVLHYDADGRRIAEWRCPKCWSRHREAKRA
jgi:hypothetical protein